MDKQNLQDLEKNLEEKYEKKNSNRKSKMRVSGASVKSLQKIIKEKR